MSRPFDSFTNRLLALLAVTIIAFGAIGYAAWAREAEAAADCAVAGGLSLHGAGGRRYCIDRDAVIDLEGSP